MTTEQDLDYALESFPNDQAYKVMLEGNLTLPEFVSANRLQMQALQTAHSIPLIEPESPAMATSFEKPYGKYTDSYFVAPADFRVVSVIPKFVNIARFNYIYVVQNMMTKVYDVIEVKHYACLSEDQGYLRPYTKGDTYKPGDIIPKGTTVYRSNSHDEYGNYRYGINPRCAYISLPENEEDGIVIRAGYREKFAFYDMRKTSITLNRNQNLLNLYGDDKNYKCIPDIGESVKDGILYAKRSINYANIAAECTDAALTHILSNDEVCKGGGVVGDIDIWVNAPEELDNCGNKAQLLKYYNACVDYYTKLFNVLDPIVNAKSRNKVQYTRKLRWHFEHARNYLDKNVIWMNNNNNIELAYLEIFTYEKKYATDGYKITDRFGSKGVITYVCPDEYMPRDELGNVADLILSPPGVIARANPGQLYEQEFNFIAGEVAKHISALPTIQAKEHMLIQFITDFSKVEGEKLVELLRNKNPAEKLEFFDDLNKSGIVLCKEPFDNVITPNKLELLYTKYKVSPTPVLICREFNDNMTALPLDNIPKAKVVDNYVIPQNEVGINPRQLDIGHKNKGVTPFDIKEGEKYTSTGLGVAPDGKGGFDSVNLYNYKSQQNTTSNKSAAPGTCVKAWINSEGYLVRQYKSFNPVIIGRKYYMLLKQMPDEKFSARSVGSTNQIGVPNKTGKQSKLMSPYAKNAIRLCEMDNDVNFCRVDPEIENRFMATHSVNPELCEMLGQMLLTEDPFELHDLPIKNEDIKDNAPALMLHAALYSIGREIGDVYEGEEDKLV